MAARDPLRGLVRLGRRVLVSSGRSLLDTVATALGALSGTKPQTEPRSIFVLRNNDIGDLLVVTPIFEALRRRFPHAKIVAGVGDWAADALRNNPFVDEVLPTNAPFFNKYCRRQGVWRRLGYVLASDEGRAIRKRRFDVGIDVLGSSWGALMLARAGIPFRVAVQGYAGGGRAAQVTIAFDPTEHVGRTALRLAEALGASDLPPARPQLYLSADELDSAETWWKSQHSGSPLRVVVGPGGGLPGKCWPPESYARLLQLLRDRTGPILLLGGRGERDLVAHLAKLAPHATHLDEAPPLRPTFALVATADLVICNSSMLMHVAAAFAKPTFVLLGEAFASTRQHDAQWGYPETCHSLGKELPQRPSIVAPEEAAAAIERRVCLRNPTTGADPTSTAIKDALSRAAKSAPPHQRPFPASGSE